MTTTPTPAAGQDTTPTYETQSERAAAGKAARVTAPRTRHGEWEPPADRPDPLAILRAQETTRVQELLPIRHGRMAASAFAFYRGAAAVMASDLAHEPRTGLTVQLCGDAHLVNFGGFGAPDRELVFDVNDFDETHPGPFEWDLKRLAASLEIAARDRDIKKAQRRDIVAWGSRAYREAIREFSGMRTLDIWYSRLDMAGIERRWGSDAGGQAVGKLEKLAAKAETKDNLKAFGKLTCVRDGELCFVSDPPLLVPIAEVYSDVDAGYIRETLGRSLQSYRKTLPNDRRHLIDQYRFVDVARKVVGVGSVGTRCWVALLLGQDVNDPLFIQVKEADASVLEPYLGKSAFPNHGRRVVEGQRLMQAASDILLGWDHAPGADGVLRDFYMRQLWDWKVTAPVETMTPQVLRVYAQICGWTLARAHARSGDAVAIGSYLGSGDVFDQSLVGFAATYADQNAKDHAALVTAIKDGDMEATEGV